MKNEKARLIISVLLLATGMALGACASLGSLFGSPVKTYGEWQTRSSKDGSLIIVRYTGKSAAVAVPAEFEGTAAVEIGEKAFFGNTALKSVTIPEGFTAIGKDAFDVCTGLTDIAIPASVIRIGKDALIGREANGAEDAFDRCTALTNITVAGENGVYSAENGVVFNKNKTALLLYPQGKSGSYTIPSSVTSVAYSAFEDCAKLTGITIPNSVTSIGFSAFMGCTGLTSLTIPVHVTSIDIRAFKGCSGLTSLTIPGSVKSIGGEIRNVNGYGAFEGCTGLTSVTILDGVASIGAAAFLECTGLISVTIPDSVTYIGGSAFAFCSNLTTVTISPIQGRNWDFIRGGDGFLIFRDCPLSNASKTAIRNAGYPPPGMLADGRADEF